MKASSESRASRRLEEQGLTAGTGDAARRLQTQPLSQRVLSLVARWWFAVVVVGQLAFAAYIALIHTLSAIHGQLGDRAKFGNHGYVAGDIAGNLAAASHILFAFLISLSAALQLVPQVRQRAPSVHRWNGRFLISGAFVVSLAGLFLIWVRGAVGDLSQHLASTLEAALIFLFSALALRTAIVRNFVAHRRWALRLFMVLSGVWFFRLGVFLWLAVNRGPAGFDQDTFTGPFLTIWGSGSYLLPLGMLELYLGAQGSGVRHVARIATAGVVVVATFGMAGGLLAVAATGWFPAIQQAYANRVSIVEPHSATNARRGVDAAVATPSPQAREPEIYDSRENQLFNSGTGYSERNQRTSTKPCTGFHGSA